MKIKHCMNHWLNVACSLKHFTVTGEILAINIFTITQYIIIYYDIFTASY